MDLYSTCSLKKQTTVDMPIQSGTLSWFQDWLDHRSNPWDEYAITPPIRFRYHEVIDNIHVLCIFLHWVTYLLCDSIGIARFIANLLRSSCNISTWHASEYLLYFIIRSNYCRTSENIILNQSDIASRFCFKYCVWEAAPWIVKQYHT